MQSDCLKAVNGSKSNAGFMYPTSPPPLPLLAMLLTCPPYPPDGETWTEDNFRDASSEPTQDIFKNKLVLSGFYEIMHV